VTFTKQSTFDEKYVVFGCAASTESFDTLEELNTFGSLGGLPMESIFISNCGQAYPTESSLEAERTKNRIVERKDV
jgi:hypothetical protein